MFVSGVQGNSSGQIQVVWGEEYCISQLGLIDISQHNARPHFLEPAMPSLTLRLPTFIYPLGAPFPSLGLTNTHSSFKHISDFASLGKSSPSPKHTP